jgi:DNA invertase Pin-like site-specific DNA recombinase
MQRRHCEQIAAGLGAKIVREYAVTGGTTDPAVRASIEGAIQALEADDVVYLITSNVSRLTRRRDELIGLGERLRASGAQLVTDADHSRTGSDLSSFMAIERSTS